MPARPGKRERQQRAGHRGRRRAEPGGTHTKHGPLLGHFDPRLDTWGARVRSPVVVAHVLCSMCQDCVKYVSILHILTHT
jgi:hypothetical protein